MTCPACSASEVNPLHGRSFVGCRGCQARELARSPMAFRALRGEPGELQEAIVAIWKDDYQAGRSAVWAWMERIKAHPP